MPPLVRFTAATQDRPTSQSPPPSSPLPPAEALVIPESPGLLRNKSFDVHDRAKISRQKKGLFSRTKSIERVFSHQVVIEQLEPLPAGPQHFSAAANATLSKKRHLVKRKSIEQLMSSLSLRSPRPSSSLASAGPPDDAQPHAAAHPLPQAHSRKKSADQASHSRKKLFSRSSKKSHSPSKEQPLDTISITNPQPSLDLIKDPLQNQTTALQPQSQSHTVSYANAQSFPQSHRYQPHQEPCSSSHHYPNDDDAMPTHTISVPDLPDMLRAQLQSQRMVDMMAGGRGRCNSTVEDHSPRLARLLSPSRRPSIEDLRLKHIWVDADEQRQKRRNVSEKLTRFFETMYADPYAKPLPIFLDHQESAKHLLTILDQHVLDYGQLEFLSNTPFAEGAYSQVYKACYQGQLVAVKRLRDIDRFKAAILRAFEREVISLKRTAHLEQVITFVGACVRPNYSVVTAFQCGGSLHEALHVRRASWGWQKKLSVASRIATGVAELHALSPPLLHRDLTTLNVFLGEGDVPFIGDFGISRFRTSGQPTSPIGHPRWKAPEIHRVSAYTTAADVYMLATIVFEICYQRKALDPALTDREVSRMLAKGFVPSLPGDSSVPPAISDLILRCWANEPTHRPSAVYVASQLDSFHP